MAVVLQTMQTSASFLRSVNLNMRIALYFLAILFVSCAGKRAPTPSPEGYDLGRPRVVNLPAELDEISGLTYYEKDKSIFAISDETGMLYKITPTTDNNTRINKWKFSKKADFEDLVLLDSIFYVLQSNGMMHIVRFIDKDSVYTKQVPFLNQDKNEFETLYYDSNQKRLIVFCKNCEDDTKNGINTYSFDPATETYSDSISTVDVKDLANQLDDKKLTYKASCAAVNPLTGELFVVSAVNKLLMVLGKDKKVKNFYRLDRGLFKQPEGITFSGNGTLIISNEAGEAGSANLLIFNYQKQ